MAKTDKIDLIGEPVYMAAEMAFRQLLAAASKIPDAPEQRSPLTLERLRQILRGE